MMSSIEQVREGVSTLSTSAWALTALGVLLEGRVVEHLREPCAIEELETRHPNLPVRRCLDIAVTTGFVVVHPMDRYQLSAGAMPFAEAPMRTALAADIRSTLMQSLTFLDAAREGRPCRGWTHTDPLLLQAQGEASAVLAPMLKRMIVPMLDGLGDRIENRGARFLDVGTGVGALAIAMCRVFPELSVVGLDVSSAALALAEKNVTAANLRARIELRSLPVEDLRDENAFDLIWLPSFFIPASPKTVCARLHASLRPGGYLILAYTGESADARSNATWSLINELWGGFHSTRPSEVEALLAEAGFSAIRALPGPDWAPSLVVATRTASPAALDVART